MCPATTNRTGRKLIVSIAETYASILVMVISKGSIFPENNRNNSGLYSEEEYTWPVTCAA
jgi:hypothetical protein